MERVGTKHRLTFLINHRDTPTTLPPPAGRDLTTDTAVNGPLELEPYGVAAILS